MKNKFFAKKIFTLENKIGDTLDNLGTKVLEEMVLPFCKKYNVKFDCGMGIYCFKFSNGTEYFGSESLNVQYIDESLELEPKVKKELKDIMEILESTILDKPIHYYIDYVK